MWVALCSTIMKTMIINTVPIATTASESRSQTRVIAECKTPLRECDSAGANVIDSTDYLYFAGLDGLRNYF
jgi:hypothetical protein